MSSKRRRRNESQGDRLPPSFYAPVHPDELKLCFNLALGAASGRMPMRWPDYKPIELVDDKGRVSRITLNDNPLARGLEAIRQHVRNTSAPSTDTLAKEVAVGARIGAMFALVTRHPLAKQWCRRGDKQTEFHEALLDAAASAELQRDGTFEPASFFALVAKIAREEYIEEHV